MGDSLSGKTVFIIPIHRKNQPLFPPQTDKILLEAPVTAGFRLYPPERFEARFDRSDELVHVFSDEDLEDEISARFEEPIRDREDRLVEFDGAVLVDAGDAGGVRSDVRGDDVERFDAVLQAECFDGGEVEDVRLEEVDVRVAERFDLLEVDAEDLAGRSDDLGNDLDEASRRGGDIEHVHAG